MTSYHGSTNTPRANQQQYEIPGSWFADTREVFRIKHQRRPISKTSQQYSNNHKHIELFLKEFLFVHIRLKKSYEVQDIISSNIKIYLLWSQRLQHNSYTVARKNQTKNMKIILNEICKTRAWSISLVMKIEILKIATFFIIQIGRSESSEYQPPPPKPLLLIGQWRAECKLQTLVVQIWSRLFCDFSCKALPYSNHGLNLLQLLPFSPSPK